MSVAVPSTWPLIFWFTWINVAPTVRPRLEVSSALSLKK
jgi:hypothetical protein